jgi:hypothetical protein
VDDVLLFSRTFEEHLRHMGIVLDKKMRAEERKIKRRAGGTRWKPQLQDWVLVKCQPTSDAAQGVTGKFRRPYEGPFRISKIIIPSIYEVSDNHGKLRGQFNLGHLKPYLESLN